MAIDRNNPPTNAPASRMSVTGCPGCATTAGHLSCPTHGPQRITSAPQGPYFVPGAPKLDPMIVTTRQVPVGCEVCKGRGVRAVGPEDDDDTEWVRCDPCNGQGWLTVTETTTGRV